MKKIVSLLLGLLMVVMATTAMAGTVTVQPGDELSMEVSIESASGKYAKIGVKTNSAPVTFVDAVGGEVNDVVPPKAFDDYFDLVNDPGITISADGTTISGTAAGPVDLVDGVIGTLTFKVNANAAAGTYTVEAYKKSGSVTVVGSVTFVVEAATSGRIPGDVNDDGEVDMRDSVLLYRYLADWGVTINMANADVNADGEVDMRDSVLLYRYLADWGVTLQ